MVLWFSQSIRESILLRMLSAPARVIFMTSRMTANAMVAKSANRLPRPLRELCERHWTQKPARGPMHLGIQLMMMGLPPQPDRKTDPGTKQKRAPAAILGDRGSERGALGLTLSDRSGSPG
jgi:hypothetical protein